MLQRAGAEAHEVRRPAQLDQVKALIIPGGESTTIGKLLIRYELMEPIRDRVKHGMPLWGTCAGLILMATDVGRDQPLLGLLDMAVERNAFGRQIDSFEADVAIEGLGGGPLHAVFIRAPLVREVRGNVTPIGRLDDGAIVAVQQDRLLATAFHPELGDDPRLHAWFAALAKAA
jgi:5'-phosphate synthase pdxT subunit